MKKISFIFFSLLFAIGLVASENYERMAPNEPEEKPGKIILPEMEKPEDSKDGDKVLIKELKRLVFQKEFEFVSYHEDQHIVIEDIEVPDEEAFEEKMSKFIDKPVSLNKLQEIKFTVIKYYRSHNIPLVGVRIPVGQDISSGEVHIIISRARLGEVKVHGNKHFSSKWLKKQIRTKPGKIIETNKVLEDLEWLNDNPFRSVNVVYEKGENIRETNIDLEVQDKFPYRIYAGYENSGFNVAGPSRWMAGINCGNLFNIEHQFNFQFMTASNINHWWGVAGNYIAPLPWRNILKIYGTYSMAKPQLEQYQDLRGKGWYLGSRYEIPLPILRKLSHDFIIGYDFKSTNNFLTFAENLIYDHYMDISQFLLKYQGTADDKWGYTSFEFSFFYSPGNMTKNNSTTDFDLERPGAKANYFYGQFDLERITKLPKKFTWILNFLFQLSDRKLLPSEQLSLGGYLSVRGYLENEVSGDKGFLLKNEIRFPPIHFHIKKLENELQFLGFIDLGVVTDVDQNILTKNSAFLLSIGPGLRYKMNENISVRVDYGWRLKDIHGRLFGASEESRFHVGVIAAY